MSDLPQLLMRRDLSGLPELCLPTGMKLMHFSNGMEACWNDIIAKSFQTPYDFDKLMRADKAFCDERVLFLCIEGVPVATAAVWHKERFDKDTGYVHMVGALPEYKGRKLGYLVTLAVMHRLKDEGFPKVVLETDDFRLPAIKIYLDLGFVADMSVHESMPERWEAVMSGLR